MKLEAMNWRASLAARLAAHPDVLEIPNGIRHDELELQVESRIAARTCGYLAPVGVGLAPVFRGLMPLERIERAVRDCHAWPCARPARCSVSGYFRVNHAGGAAPDVPTTTQMPCLAAGATARSSQSTSNSPSRGSRRLHANSPTRTTWMWAASIKLKS
jgi:hypothetical protein